MARFSTTFALVKQNTHVGEGSVPFHELLQPEVVITLSFEGQCNPAFEYMRVLKANPRSRGDALGKAMSQAKTGGVTEQRASSSLVFLVKGRPD